MEVYEAIRKRKSTRNYTDEEVKQEQIEQVLEAGRLAPFAGLAQAGKTDFRHFFVIKRGSETQESLMTRFKNAYQEINYVSKYNYAVVNDEVDTAVEKIEGIIVAEKCRVDRIKDTILDSKEGVIHEQLYD